MEETLGPHHTKLGYRRCHCRTYQRCFNERAETAYNRLQYSTDIVSFVVLWRVSYKLSLRDLAEMFLQRGIASAIVGIGQVEHVIVQPLRSEEAVRTEGRLGRLGISMKASPPAQEGTRDGHRAMVISGISRLFLELRWNGECGCQDQAQFDISLRSYPRLEHYQTVWANRIRGVVRPRMLSPFSSNTSLASWRSAVSNPSVNQP